MKEDAMHEDLFIDSLGENDAAMPVCALRRLTEFAGHKPIATTRELDVERFAQMELCRLTPMAVPQPDFYRYWGGEEFDRLYTQYNQVVWQVEWEGNDLTVVHIEWTSSCGGDERDWVIADSLEIAESFILEVSRKTHAPGNAILVFSGGSWQRSESLYQATQSATFDDLILAEDLKSAIRLDFANFLKSEDRYDRLGISWRRGALFIGPPGNGKTHCVRALIKELGVSSLYVQSLSHQYYTAEQMWRKVFARARGLRPCVLVLEDLDALVDDKNRSFFLNQLDGLEQNHGLIVLATTNHPERIDSAIMDRPSRFDRKYHFDLPTQIERTSYLLIWQRRLASEIGWAESEVQPAAEACEGFSFAYMKELIISSVMQWMGDESRHFKDVIEAQAAVLQKQMRTDKSPPPSK
ncbi:MAG: ATP-binding protein [Pirellulaceae bacterium]